MPELNTGDFSFTGRLGSHGARIAKVGPNHFRVELGQAPGHPEWFNLLQFEILRHAKGNRLRLERLVQTGGRNIQEHPLQSRRLHLVLRCAQLDRD